MLTLRTTLAQIVMTFEIRFIPGEGGVGFENNAVDHFMLSFEEVYISFTKRQ